MHQLSKQEQFQSIQSMKDMTQVDKALIPGTHMDRKPIIPNIIKF